MQIVEAAADRCELRLVDQTLDAGLVLLAETAEHLGLPFQSPATATLLVDKLRQREALAGPPVAIAMPPPRLLARLPDDFPWPAVLKPRTESGGRIPRTEAAEPADRLKPGGTREEMLLEEYLVGADIAAVPFADYPSVETAVSDGELSHLALTGRFPPAQTSARPGSSYPPLSTTRAATSCSTWRQRQARPEIKLAPSGPPS